MVKYPFGNIISNIPLPLRNRFIDLSINNIPNCCLIFSSVFIILEDNSENIVATNGFWRIRIADEKQRLNFYSYLFTEDYKKQMETLATGTLLTDVKEEDLIEKLFIPTNKIEKNYEKMKKFLAVQKELYSSL